MSDYEEVEIEVEEEIEVTEEVEENTENENQNNYKDKENNDNNGSNINIINNNDKNEINKTNNKIINKKEAQTNSNYYINNDKETDNDSNFNEKGKNIYGGEEEYYIEELVKIIKDIEIFNLIDNKKWENKKLGYIKLNEFILNNKINENNIELFFMYIFTKLNYFKETNIILLIEGIQCIISIFNNINQFKDNNNKQITLDKKYLNIIINGLFEKIANNKIKKSYLKLLETLENNYTYKDIINSLNDELKDTNKIKILKEYALYLKNLIENKKILEKNNENKINIQIIINFTIKLSNNQNPELREISFNILCLLYKIIGTELKLYLKEIKNQTIVKKIEKEFDRIDSELNVNNNNINNININNNINNVKKVNNNINKVNNINKNINENSLKKHMSNLIPKSLIKMINRGKWNEKKEAIDFIHNVLDKENNNIPSFDLKELLNLIKEKLKDGNKNLVKLILELLSHLIDTLESHINNYSDFLIPPLLSNLSEKNIIIKQECLKCIRKWIKYQDFKIFCYYFPQLLINDNYEMRNSILDLMIENCNLIKKNYKQSFFSELTNSLLICLQDRNLTIRNKTEELMKKFHLINMDDYIKKTKSFKPEIEKLLTNNIKCIFGEEDSSYIRSETSREKTSMNQTNNKIKTLYLNNDIKNQIIKPNNLSKIKNRKLNNSVQTRNRKKELNISVDPKENKKNLVYNYKCIINGQAFGKTTNSKKNKNSSLVSSFGGYTTTPKYKKNILFAETVNNYTNNKNVKIKKMLNLVCNNTTYDSNNSIKNKKQNYIRLNLANLINNNSFEYSKNIITDGNYNEKLKIFLDNYKINKMAKEKRYDLDKKNNFLLEIQNFNFLAKLKEISKTIFSPEFYKKFFSYDSTQVIYCINKLKLIIDKNNNKNDIILKIIENIDIILKTIGFIFISNQSSSLIKCFFEFIESLIKYYIKEKHIFNDIEIKILLNILCDKLINSNNLLAANANDLIFQLYNLIGDNKTYMMLVYLIKYKNNKLKNKIIDIILKIYEKRNIDNNIISKSLKNIISLYFESDITIKNKVIIILKKIYTVLDKSDFIESFKSLPSQQKEEIIIKILGEENIKDFKEKVNINEVKRHKRHINSEQKKIVNKSKKGNNLLNKNIFMKVTYRKHNNTNILNYKEDIIINNDYNSIDKNKYHVKNYNSNIKNKINKNYSNTSKKKKGVFLNNSVCHRKMNKNNNLNKNDEIKNEINNDKIKKNLNITYNNIISNIKVLNTNNLKNSKNDKHNNINDTKIEKINDNKGKLTEEELDELLSSLYSTTQIDDGKKKMECIINIHDKIYSDYSSNSNVIIKNSDKIIDILINTIKKYFEKISDDIKSLKYLTNAFCLICNIKELLSNISYEIEEKLINLIFYVVLFNNLKDMGEKKEGLNIWRSYNSIFLRIIENCNHTNTINILIKQIAKNKDKNSKYNEYRIRCLEIIIHRMKDIYNKINVSKILFEINKMLIDLNITEEKLKDINEYNIIPIIKKLIFSIINIKKDFNKDYNEFINNIINGKDESNNIINFLINGYLNNLNV